MFDAYLSSYLLFCVHYSQDLYVTFIVSWAHRWYGIHDACTIVFASRS